MIEALDNIWLFISFYLGFMTGIAFVNWYLGNRK
jgi:hypothetical protein